MDDGGERIEEGEFFFAGEGLDGMGQRIGGERAGGDNHAVPIFGGQAIDLASLERDEGMIFQGARLADVANVLIGGTLVGGAAAFASYIVT